MLVCTDQSKLIIGKAPFKIINDDLKKLLNNLIVKWT